jgi:hypothetical protein
MSSVIDPELHRRNFRTVFALAGLFLLPLLLSFWLYYGLHWRPQGTASHGELIVPARPLPDITLADAGRAHFFREVEPGVCGRRRLRCELPQYAVLHAPDAAVTQ